MIENKKIKVQVWIHCGDEVLILKTNQARGAFWQPVTGGLKKFENPEEAALREAEEETGLHFSEAPRDLDCAFDYAGKNRMIHEICFALQVPHKDQPKLSAEHQDYRWLHYKEAETELKFESNKLPLTKLFAD